MADLFGPQTARPSGSFRPDLPHLGYTITWDTIEDPNIPPELRLQWADLYHEVQNRPTRALAQKLRQLVSQYPAVAALKNFLTVVYVSLGETKRAGDVLDETLRQHPRYLLALTNKAHQLLIRQDTAGVDALFGGPPTDIGQLYPDRTRFNVSEVAHFTHLVFEYAAAKYNPETARTQLRFLCQLRYHTKPQLRRMKRELDFTQMKANMARMNDLMEKAIQVKGRFRADDQQTTLAPLFENPEIQWLYEYGFDLPAQKRDAILALPRPSLTADLAAVLRDSLYRYRHFEQQDWNKQQHNFASHALLLAAELRADECLEAVLDTLRQDDTFLDFWWGDMLDEFYVPYFRRLLPAQAPALMAFVYEPNVAHYGKAAVSTAYSQEALANPALLPAAQTWYADVLTYLTEQADNEHLFDSDLMAFLIGNIEDLQLTDLMPLIREAYNRNLVSESITGNLADVERSIIKPSYPILRLIPKPIAQHYDYLNDPDAYYEKYPEPKQDTDPAFLAELIADEAEWDFLEEDDDEKAQNETANNRLLPAGSRFSQLALPQKAQPKPNRNDKVAVRYTDGTVLRDVKYKKVEADIETGKCVLLPN